MSRSTRFVIYLLFLLVIVSLALNGFILWQLYQVRQQARQAAREFGPAVQESLAGLIADLDELEDTPVEIEVAIDQEIPIQTEIAFNEELEVPIQTIVPISQTIETVIMLEVVGGVEVPIDIAVPVNVEVPIDTTVSIPIERTVPISTTIPVKLDVPIQIDLARTEGLAGYIGRLREGLISLDKFLDRALAQVD